MKFPEEVYSPKRFREQGSAVVELIATCIEDSISGTQNKVIEMTDPATAMAEVQQWFDQCAADESKDVVGLFSNIYQRAITNIIVRTIHNVCAHDCFCFQS